MLISLVVAAAENGAIGKSNRMLWHLPNDLKYFKNVTWGMPVLMGRKTFEALGNKPLNGRSNIILTHNKKFKAEHAVVVSKLDDVFFFVNENDFKELMVIGGGEIYNLMMPKADRIFLTRVHENFPDADAFFPLMDEKIWVRKKSENFEADDKHQYSYTFEVWERK